MMNYRHTNLAGQLRAMLKLFWQALTLLNRIQGLGNLPSARDPAARKTNQAFLRQFNPRLRRISSAYMASWHDMGDQSVYFSSHE